MKKSLLRMFLYTVLALGVAAGATVWRAEARRAEAEETYPPTGEFVTVNGQRIHAVTMGPEDAPAVVLIHGSSGSTRDMTFRLAPALAGDFRVIVLDRPGMGWSEASPVTDTIFRQAEVLSAATKQLGAERPIVVGQSYGGAVALAWALQGPEEVAALVNVAGPTTPWPTPLSTYYKTLSTPVIRHIAAWSIAAWVPERVVRDEISSVFAPQEMPDGFIDHFGPGMTLRPSALLANATHRANLLDEVRQMADSYDALTMPVEIVHGTADDTVSPELHVPPLVAQAPEANFTPLTGIGHMPHHVVTEDVVAAVERAATRAGLR